MPLLDAAVRAALVLSLAWLATRAMGRAAAGTRHLVWTLAVVAALCVPLCNALVPEWRVLPASSLRARAMPNHEVERRSALPSGSGEAQPDKTRLAGGAEALPHTSIPLARRFSAVWLLIPWAVVSMSLLAHVGFGIAAVKRLARHARPADARWRERLDHISDVADVRQRVRLLVSPDVAMPMTWGGRRPVLLLPMEALDWTDERAQVVLLHELAHVRRGDWLTHVIARVLAAVYWFNPLAWVALHGMTRERERACDDFVLARGAKPSEYAQHLLDIARAGISGTSYAIAPAMARPSELEGRLLSILTPRRREPRRVTAQALVAIGMALTVAVSAASSEQQEPAAQPANVTRSVPATSTLR